MGPYRRYAVYYAPPAGSALARFGASWLGWDPDAGAPVRHPEIDAAGLDIARLTATPRRYGFHGTLKPPFRLADGAGFAVLDAAVGGLSKTLAPFEVPALELRRLGRFIALAPSARSAPLAGLASACVARLDHLRHPPSEAEIARRRAAGLSPKQERNLQRWGYPYVMDEFRFHLTLTGGLPDHEAERALEVLEPLTAPFRREPLGVREICVFGEAEGDRFHLLRRYPLTG